MTQLLQASREIKRLNEEIARQKNTCDEYYRQWGEYSKECFELKAEIVRLKEEDKKSRNCIDNCNHSTKALLKRAENYYLENLKLQASLSETQEANTKLLQQRDYLQREVVEAREDRDKHFSAATHYEAELFCANKKLDTIRGIGVEDLIRDWVAGTPTNKLENELVTLSWGDLRHLATHIVAKLKEVGE